LIDPDENNGDLTRTVRTMQDYRKIRASLTFDNSTQNQFFKTPITPGVPNFRLPLNNTQNVRFEQYINVASMNKANQALIRMLFSENNLSADMQVGFKGNPNMGSVVLNQFEQSDLFREFANGFIQGDKIFIISSIFGGTGASGFPLLLKTLRQTKQLPNSQYLNTAPIGAVTVLPYFKVEQQAGAAIESDSFMGKTRSALSYYERNISRNQSIDALYYVGDSHTTNPYNYSEGGNTQTNKAHFMELLAALAVLDFSKLSISSQENKQTVHKEFGLEQLRPNENIIFSDFAPYTREQIAKPLTQCILMTKYLQEVNESIMLGQTWSKAKDLDLSFLRGSFMQNLRSFLIGFEKWLKEMQENSRSFAPFTLTGTKRKDPFTIVNGITPAGGGLFSKQGYALFDSRLNSKQKTLTNGNKEQLFMELFYSVTNQLTKEKFNM